MMGLSGFSATSDNLPLRPGGRPLGLPRQPIARFISAGRAQDGNGSRANRSLGFAEPLVSRFLEKG